MLPLKVASYAQRSVTGLYCHDKQCTGGGPIPPAADLPLLFFNFGYTREIGGATVRQDFLCGWKVALGSFIYFSQDAAAEKKEMKELFRCCFWPCLLNTLAPMDLDYYYI